MLGVAALILGPLLWSLHKATIPLAPNEEGWIVSRRSIFDHVMGAIQFGFSVLWLAVAILAPLFLPDKSLKFNYATSAAMILLSILFLYYFCLSYAADIRFTDERLEYRAVFRRISVFWTEVNIIRMGMNGPSIRTVYGNFSISNTRRGFYQLLATARENGVAIQDSPYLKPHDTYWPYKKKNK